MTIHHVESIEFDGASFVLEIGDGRGDTTTMFVDGKVCMTVRYETVGQDEKIIVIIE